MGKTWFITGAARGLGAAIATAALAAGDNVVATARDPEKAAQALPGAPDRLLPVALDVADAAQVGPAVEAAVARFGAIDVLVNNAGYGQFGAFESNTPAEVERQFATNVFGLFNVTRAVLPVMRRQRAGRIFNISSIGGLRGAMGGSLYAATKFAMEGFSESLAQEIAPFGIKLTLIEPGFFRTDFLDGNSVRYGTLPIEDYATLTAALRARYDGHNHQQAGDPAKLAQIMVDLASYAEPPLRFLAGSDAQEFAAAKIERMTAEFAAWRALSVSTDI